MAQIISYTVRDGDTLPRIALAYTRAAEHWLQLAILNNLDYPYLSGDSNFPRELKATGGVVFTRTAGSTGAVTVPAGYGVSAPSTANAPERDYTLDAPVVIPDGQDTAAGTVTALLAGELGNTPQSTVTALGTAITHLAAVTNPAALLGGAILNVKVPGDSLLVYTDASGAASTAGVDTQRLRGGQPAFLAALLGADLALDQSGDLAADSRGGLRTGAGTANLVAALQRRFHTSLGFYPYNPAYGTGVEQAVGQRAQPHWLQWARLEAERTVRTDPRVQDVQNVQASYTAGTLTLSCDILVIGQQTPQNLVVALRTPGG